MKIFVNPGHALGGNPDPGAVNRTLGIRECDITLTIGSLAASRLEQDGHAVRLLQSDNLAGEAPGPCVTREANRWQADLFLSVHCNAYDGQARGTETLYYPGSAGGALLASCVQRELCLALSRLDPAMPDRGIKERPHLVVLRCTHMPAILVETAFIDQPQDARLLMEHGAAFAEAIARGVAAYGHANAGSRP